MKTLYIILLLSLTASFTLAEERYDFISFVYAIDWDEDFSTIKRKHDKSIFPLRKKYKNEMTQIEGKFGVEGIILADQVYQVRFNTQQNKDRLISLYFTPVKKTSNHFDKVFNELVSLLGPHYIESENYVNNTYFTECGVSKEYLWMVNQTRIYLYRTNPEKPAKSSAVIFVMPVHNRFYYSDMIQLYEKKESEKSAARAHRRMMLEERKKEYWEKKELETTIQNAVEKALKNNQ